MASLIYRVWKMAILIDEATLTLLEPHVKGLALRKHRLRAPGRAACTGICTPLQSRLIAGELAWVCSPPCSSRCLRPRAHLLRSPLLKVCSNSSDSCHVRRSLEHHRRTDCRHRKPIPQTYSKRLPVGPSVWLCVAHGLPGRQPGACPALASALEAQTMFSGSASKNSPH